MIEESLTGVVGMNCIECGVEPVVYIKFTQDFNHQFVRSAYGYCKACLKANREKKQSREGDEEYEGY